jgi:hypothetical protein
MTVVSSQTRFRIFLAALSIAGSVLVWLATSSFGPGLSTDGARYLSTAESIAAGRGIIDYLGLPLVNWPPLYPIILAAINLLTGLDVFVIGQIVNILAFGAIIYLEGIFFERSFAGNLTFAVAATLILATSLPLLEVSANIASDSLFLITVLVFLFAAADYAKSPTRNRWLLLAAIAITSCFLRYAGLALVFSGAAIVFLTWRSSLRRAFVEAAGFGLLAGMPLAAFALFHNLPAAGTLLGSHRPSDPVGLFVVAIEKIISWFMPETVLQLIPPLIIAAALLLLVVLRSSKERWAAWLRRILEPATLPSVMFTAVYGAMLVFAISYSEHRVPGSQRIHALILPTLLVLAAITYQTFAPKLKLAWRNILLGVFALWLLFPIYRIGVYVSASMQHGDVSYYNLYNTRSLRESDIVAELKGLELTPEEKVYSNNEGAAWFYLRRRIYRLPRYNAEIGEDLATAMLTFTGWPDADENATLIWFKRELDYKEEVPTPEEMSQFIQLIPTFTGRNGTIYLMDVDIK